MPTARISPRGSTDTIASENLRSCVAFALLGFVNTILPSIIFSANYLIIPFPRPIVILIEVVPALVIKILLPHLLSNIALWMRPTILASCWIVASGITMAAPPNVEPPLRVGAVLLASATAAATEVSLLAQMKHHGRTGLAGWGLGTGVGTVVCSIVPFVLTIVMGGVLRDGIIYNFYLVAVLLTAYYTVLPKKSPSRFGVPGRLSKDDPRGQEEGLSALCRKPASSAAFPNRIRRNLKQIQPLLRPYIVPLFLTFSAQRIVFPGIVRANGKAPSFDTFSGFYTASGLSFALGNCISRSLSLTVRAYKPQTLVPISGLLATAVLVNSIFFVTFSFDITLPLLFCAGILGGGTYVATVVLAMDAQRYDSDEEGFVMGVMGSGETAGMLVGGLIGTLLEAQLCSHGPGLGHRWCWTTR